MNRFEFEKILNLIKQTRLRKSTSRGELIESESDKGRVINSAPFRRLQQKAQVFPLDPNASVRTRLTHSIEVSQVGRHLAQKIIGRGKFEAIGYAKLAAFVNTIETACLLHDIGNPPFGHLGESAIREWFTEKKTQIADLKEFDGNPQGFRLASFLAGEDNYGFNLTATQLLSSVKYPWTLADKGKAKKIGLFDSDLRYYQEACEIVNWKPGRLFPLMQLMDVADEIAYSMSDLEDGLEKKIISLPELLHEFSKWNHLWREMPKTFLGFKIGVINFAVDMAASTFASNADAVLTGQKVSFIDKNSEVGELLSAVKTFAIAKIYSHESAEQVELAGRSVVKGLLNHFGPLLNLPKKKFDMLVISDRDGIKKERLDFEIRLFRRLPISYCEKYISSKRGNEAYRRAHLIVDTISGMTDDYALETYQILEGIRIK
jgi:dGTPase